MKGKSKSEQKEKELVETNGWNYGIYYYESCIDEAPEIVVNHLDLSFDNKCLFDDLEFTLHSDNKVTIVGDNGLGKTTFLKLISGSKDYSYSGTISIKGRLAFLPQHFEEVDENEVSVITLLRSMHDPSVDDFLNQTQLEPFSHDWIQELNFLGGHELFKQIHLIGLSVELLKKPFKMLSGGQKTKVLLVALSLIEPDIVLLDEPTNHLDDQGITWLETYLKNFDGGVVMVTHDRSLINAVSNRISELSPHTKRFTNFRGGYKNYLEEEEKRRQKLIEERQHQEKEQKKLMVKSKEAKEKVKSRIIRSGTDRDKISYNNKETRANKGNTRLVNQFSNKLEQLKDDMVDVIPQRSHIEFDVKNIDAFDPTLLSIEVVDVAKSYNEKLFEKVSFSLRGGERLVIRGPNGCGKSTLLKIIDNLIQPDNGTVTLSSDATVGYLDQEQETLELDKSPVELLQDDPRINAKKQVAIKCLRDFGVYSWHDLKTPLKQLSVGCRRKAQLCQIMMRNCSIILLDEPTNHIDFPSLETIEAGLLKFPGIIIAATHDRYFTEKIATRVLDLSEFQAH